VSWEVLLCAEGENSNGKKQVCVAADCAARGPSPRKRYSRQELVRWLRSCELRITLQGRTELSAEDLGRIQSAAAAVEEELDDGDMFPVRLVLGACVILLLATAVAGFAGAAAWEALQSAWSGYE